MQLKNDNFQAFDATWDEVLPEGTDRPTDNTLKSVQDAIGKSQEWDYVLQVFAQETTFGDNN